MNSFGDNICPRDGRKMTNPGNPLADNKWEITHINRIDPVLGREKSQEIPLYLPNHCLFWSIQPSMITKPNVNLFL